MATDHSKGDTQTENTGPAVLQYEQNNEDRNNLWIYVIADGIRASRRESRDGKQSEHDSDNPKQGIAGDGIRGEYGDGD